MEKKKINNVNMNSVTDKTYLEMAIGAYYNNISVKDKLNFNLNMESKGKWNQVSWKVIKVLNDPDTDTQAFAFKNGDNIVISYRGSKELHDWIHTDKNYLVLGGSKLPSETAKEIKYYSDSASIKGTLGVPSTSLKDYEKKKVKDLKNAFDVSVDFAESIKKKYPNASIHTTGHSLGGAQATYTRAMLPWIAQTTTFAAPNVYGMLPDDVQEKIDRGVFRNNTVDYTDKWDTFGVLNDRFPQVGMQHFVENESFWLGNHSSEKFHKLINAAGQIRLTPEIAKQLSLQADKIANDIELTEKLIRDCQSWHDDVIHQIQQDFEARLNSDFPLLSTNDVREIIEEYALTFRGGRPVFYDIRAEESLLDSIELVKNDTKDVANNLDHMADRFEERDLAIANWLKK